MVIEKMVHIAYYEIKVILRTRIFRLFPIFTLVAFGYMHLNLSSLWVIHGIPSMHPYSSLLVFNFIQSFFIIFTAPRFLIEDHELDGTKVLYTHSFANATFLLGKATGVLMVYAFSTLCYLFLAYGIAYLTLTDISVHFWQYLYYALLIPLPTLVLLTGLSILIVSIVRNQGAALMIMLFFVVFTFLFTLNVGHNLLDFRAINIPLLYSNFIGFSNLRVVLMQRSMFVLIGVACLFVSALLFPRLRQNRLTVPFSILVTILSIVSACWLGARYMDHFDRGITLRTNIRALNKQYAANPLVTVTDCSINLKHTGNTIEV